MPREPACEDGTAWLYWMKLAASVTWTHFSQGLWRCLVKGIIRCVQTSHVLWKGLRLWQMINEKIRGFRKMQISSFVNLSLGRKKSCFPKALRPLLFLSHQGSARAVSHTWTRLHLSSMFLSGSWQNVGGKGCSVRWFSSNSVFLKLYFMITP